MEDEGKGAEEEQETQEVRPRGETVGQRIVDLRCQGLDES